MNEEFSSWRDNEWWGFFVSAEKWDGKSGGTGGGCRGGVKWHFENN